ncbi:SDR family NAD(P)-dependent oxidoreductase [Bacillus gobiensis]|uniref:SDR family NAD(P)-dependent oxidoreductase n=1 Tax=Bacillus gobiensis TaxID=1441095 RepID=UPI003D242910
MTIFSSSALEGKHVLITGATGGIGFETAKVTAAMGARLTVTGRNESKLSELATELSAMTDKQKIFVRAADITKEEDRAQLLEEAEAIHGNITGLVNSAAIAGGTTVDELKEEDLDRMMHLNLTSTIMLTKAVYKKMLEIKNGTIVNVSSLSGLRGTYGNAAYSSSKFALIGFTQSLSVEAIPSNIRVNAVCPGYVDTKMGRDVIERNAKQNGVSFEEQLAEIEKGIPSGRITTPVEVANTIAFLLTDAAPNIVGESIKISGGSVL